MLTEKDKTAREVILERGGEGSQVHQLTTGYADKTLGELAELATQGDKSAVTALKIIKQAPKKAQKYGGKS